MDNAGGNVSVLEVERKRPLHASPVHEVLEAKRIRLQCVEDMRTVESDVPAAQTNLSDLSVAGKGWNDELTLYVKGLRTWVQERDLWELFSTNCQVKRLNLYRQANGRSRGFAYVQFFTIEGLEAGLRLNGQMLQRKALTVLRSNPSSAAAADRHTHTPKAAALYTQHVPQEAQGQPTPDYDMTEAAKADESAHQAPTVQQGTVGGTCAAGPFLPRAVSVRGCKTHMRTT